MRKKIDEKTARRRSLKNVRWVSHYLGISRNTVHQWVLEGHIPYINLGVTGGRRIIRFDPEVIETWLCERSYAPGREKQEQEQARAGDEIE
jgi:excisionase family DNA binding protein